MTAESNLARLDTFRILPKARAYWKTINASIWNGSPSVPLFSRPLSTTALRYVPALAHIACEPRHKTKGELVILL